MAFVNKTLAQAAPGPVLTDLYVTPKTTQTTMSITVCNRGVFADTFRIAIAPNGADNDPKQYIAYDKIVEANSTETINNIYLQAGDVVRVFASVDEISFVAMGTESR